MSEVWKFLGNFPRRFLFLPLSFSSLFPLSLFFLFLFSLGPQPSSPPSLSSFPGPAHLPSSSPARPRLGPFPRAACSFPQRAPARVALPRPAASSRRLGLARVPAQSRAASPRLAQLPRTSPRRAARPIPPPSLFCCAARNSADPRRALVPSPCGAARRCLGPRVPRRRPALRGIKPRGRARAPLPRSLPLASSLLRLAELRPSSAPPPSSPLRRTRRPPELPADHRTPEPPSGAHEDHRGAGAPKHREPPRLPPRRPEEEEDLPSKGIKGRPLLPLPRFSA